MFVASFLAESSSPEVPNFQYETGIVEMDYQASIQAIANSTEKSKKRKSFSHWSDKDHFKIEKYAAAHTLQLEQRNLQQKINQ